jgi:hypothetical protein
MIGVLAAQCSSQNLKNLYPQHTLNIIIIFVVLFIFNNKMFKVRTWVLFHKIFNIISFNIINFLRFILRMECQRIK